MVIAIIHSIGIGIGYWYR